MQKKAIILDLDNTIYAVHSIGHTLFASLFNLIEEERLYTDKMDAIKDDIMRRPFQLVAKDHGFSEALSAKAIAHLKTLSFEGRIDPYPDYQFVRELLINKFLVTTGFKNLQQSKIAAMDIAKDFKEVHIVDPGESGRTKKDVFADIMQRHGYKNEDVLVVGDDLHSEIKAAQELGADVALYDRENHHSAVSNITRIGNFKELIPLL